MLSVSLCWRGPVGKCPGHRHRLRPASGSPGASLGPLFGPTWGPPCFRPSWCFPPQPARLCVTPFSPHPPLPHKRPWQKPWGGRGGGLREAQCLSEAGVRAALAAPQNPQTAYVKSVFFSFDWRFSQGVCALRVLAALAVSFVASGS